MAGYLITTLMQIFRSVGKRIITIGQYLANILTKVKWHVFMALLYSDVSLTLILYFKPTAI